MAVRQKLSEIGKLHYYSELIGAGVFSSATQAQEECSGVCVSAVCGVCVSVSFSVWDFWVTLCAVSANVHVCVILQHVCVCDFMCVCTVHTCVRVCLS